MNMNNHPIVGVPHDFSKAIQRQPDSSALIFHCIGGFRGAKVEKDSWIILPVLEEGQAYAKGHLTEAQFRSFLDQNGFTPIAFQNLDWMDGTYHSSWVPIIPGQKKHSLGPADLWRNISSNISQKRSADDLKKMSTPSPEKIADLLDNRTEAERLAQSISLSLRNMGISIEQISGYYHEQLLNLMASGQISGQLSATTQDQTLYALVQSFFTHLGSARDYLGAFIALEVGKDPRKVDCMARLIDALRPHHFGSSPLLELLQSHKLIQPSASKTNRWVASGWLLSATKLRNEFVHKRPYGSKFSEASGCLKTVDSKAGLYRYFRPIVINENADGDVLDVIIHHYKNITALFYGAAKQSGYNNSMRTISSKDIGSLKWNKR